MKKILTYEEISKYFRMYDKEALYLKKELQAFFEAKNTALMQNLGFRRTRGTKRKQSFRKSKQRRK